MSEFGGSNLSALDCGRGDPRPREVKLVELFDTRFVLTSVELVLESTDTVSP